MVPMTNLDILKRIYRSEIAVVQEIARNSEKYASKAVYYNPRNGVIRIFDSLNKYKRSYQVHQPS